jgi:hypothetical protein
MVVDVGEHLKESFAVQVDMIACSDLKQRVEKFKIYILDLSFLFEYFPHLLIPFE